MTSRAGTRMRHSLRSRLVIIVGTLLAIALAATGVASTFIMQNNLSRQLAGSLFVASDAATGSIYDRVTAESQLASADTLSYLYLLGPGSYQVLLDPNGAVLSSTLLTDDYELSRLTSTQQKAAVALARSSDDVSSGAIDGLGSVVSILSPFTLDGVDGTFTLINGASTAPIDATLREYVTTGVLIGLLALVVASVTGWWIIRRSLAPLERVVDLADEVVATPLSAGQVSLPARAGITTESGSSEAGRVSAALTRLLDHVEQALNVRHEAEESIRRFSADASHELKNPLASIRGYADHYRHAPELSETTRDALERINSEAVRMSKLVSDLLMLTKVNASPELVRDSVDLTRVVLEVVADTRIAFTDHRWRIDIPEEPVTIESDESALRQVLLNLTSNAGAHTPTGTTVTIGLVAHSDTVEIAVRDNGPGISADAIERIFEPFAQDSVAANRRSTGSVGLGLTIARSLTEWLGGLLVVTSDENGSEFLVTVPRR